MGVNQVAATLNVAVTAVLPVEVGVEILSHQLLLLLLAPTLLPRLTVTKSVNQTVTSSQFGALPCNLSQNNKILPFFLAHWAAVGKKVGVRRTTVVKGRA